MRFNNNLNNTQNFTSLNPLKIPLSTFYDKNAVIPTLIIETGVTLGRSRQGYKQGGKKEAADRFVEQGASAVIWIWGVQFLKKIGEMFGKKFLNLKNLDFSVGRDILRDPVKNNKIDKKTAAFKVGNLFFSTALATYFIGFVLPKISRKISNKVDEKRAMQENGKKSPAKNILTFEEFQNKTSKNGKNINFTSLLDKSLGFAHMLENNSTARLLMTDSGVIAGRCKNAPNKSRKIGNIFRDVSSIYFYLFSTAHTVKILNKISKNTDIDPKILSKTAEMLKTINASGKDEFLASALGEICEKDKKQLDELFNSKEIISTEEFIARFPALKEKALKMSDLQPVFENKRVLTKLQAQDVLSSGKISDPEFLKETFDFATKKDASNKLKFVSKKSLEKMRLSMDDFVRQIYASADENVSGELIEKIANKNIVKNFAFYSIGTALSIFALGNVIPKIQYAIVKKLAKKDEVSD